MKEEGRKEIRKEVKKEEREGEKRQGYKEREEKGRVEFLESKTKRKERNHSG